MVSGGVAVVDDSQTLGGGWVGGRADADDDRGVTAFDLVASCEDGGCGERDLVEARAVGGAEVFDPPLAVVETQAHVAGRDGIIVEDEIAGGVASEREFGLVKNAARCPAASMLDGEVERGGFAERKGKPLLLQSAPKSEQCPSEERVKTDGEGESQDEYEDCAHFFLMRESG